MSTANNEERRMDFDQPEIAAINLITRAVEEEGCTLTDVDFDSLTIKVDGPDKVIGACARAVAEILD